MVTVGRRLRMQGWGRGAGSRLFLRGPLQKEYSAGPQRLGL